MLPRYGSFSGKSSLVDLGGRGRLSESQERRQDGDEKLREENAQTD